MIMKKEIGKLGIMIVGNQKLVITWHFQANISPTYILLLDPLSANPTKWLNTSNNSLANCRRIA